jgi:hypothetical protein
MPRESDENASSPSPDVVWRSLPPVPQERTVLLQREPSLPPSQDVDDDDDLDAKWNAIMQKTSPAPAATPPAPAPAPAAHHQQRLLSRARDPSVGAEEMNRQFDDFIKKNRNSFGRH